MSSGIIYFLLAPLILVYGQDVLVRIRDGTIRGRTSRVEDTDLDVFLGIPFAEPPIGELRFQRPVAPRKWDEVRDATQYGSACPQLHLKPQFNVSTDEDCLYLNVHTPTAARTMSASLPVMVYIHGGSFLYGSGAFLDPSLLAARDVVMVTINYRLDVLGFLSIGESSAPGNYGMMDQVMALTWVRDNIATFGGNPDDVTLLGYSAGSASVSLHLLSPLSRGLFHKVFAQSGNSVAPWAAATSRDPVSPRDVALTLADKVNCSGSDSSVVLSCLRGVSPIDLINAGRTIKSPPRGRVTWSPVVETYYNFLPELPRVIIESGGAAKVPVLLGANRDEFSKSVAAIEGSDNGVNASTFERKIHEFSSQRYPQLQYTVEEAIERVYLESIDHRDPLAVRAAYVKMLTDVNFMAPAVLESELLTAVPARSSVYLYQLAYIPENNPSPKWQGVSHNIGLLPYTFGVPIMGSKGYSWKWTWKWTDQDKAFSRHVINMTVNFVKTGNPTPTPVNGLTWKPFTTSEKNYVYLDLQPEMKSDLRPDDMRFWNSELPRILNERMTPPIQASATQNIHNLSVVLALATLANYLRG